LYTSKGGDLVSTWVAKPEGHVEEVTILVKKVAKQILANKARKSAVAPNDAVFGGVAALAA
jgi:hypothetical protein